MNIFKAYWMQVKAFYRGMGRELFLRDRDLDGELRNFAMSKGFVWQALEVHMWLLRSIWMVFRNTFQVLFCYVAMVLICGMLLIAPALIILIFPVFTIKRYRRLKREARSL